MKVILVIVFMLTTLQASAECGGFICETVRSIGNSVAAAGKAIDYKRRRLQRAANDVISFGSSVAERKKAKAEEAERRAKRERDQTAATLAEQLKDYQNQRAGLVLSKRSSDIVIQYISLIKSQNANGVEMMKALFDAIRGNQANLTQIQALLKNQRNDIHNFIASLGLDQLKSKERFSAQVQRRLEIYDLQLSKFPNKNVPRPQMEAWFNEVSNSYAIIGITIDKINVWMLAEQTRIQEEIKTIDAAILILQGSKK